MNCIAQPEIGLDEWATRLLAPLGNKRYPLSATMELTDRCNLNCVHCYINQPVNSKVAMARELGTEQVKAILNQMAESGTLFVMLTGGELLLRPDFEEIYLHARHLGLIVTIFTNGTLIDERIADLFAKVPPRSVEITLEGATAEVFESVTRVKGSYKDCLRGIKLLHDRGIKTKVKTVLLTLNQQELPAIIELAETLGVSHRYDSTIWPRLDGGQSPYRYRLSPELSLDFDLADSLRTEERYKSGKKMVGVSARRFQAVSCGAGFRSYHIDSAGNLSACMMLRKPSYNLLKMPFVEAWDRLGEVRKIQRVKHTECENCFANNLCSQCAGWSQMVHNDYETPDTFVCLSGKLKLRRFGAGINEPVLEEIYE